ncbi:MAG TPA: cadmium resistance transporter [Rhizomicrobium sp.]|jgi:cadmium resistance protein CadD (predicted permease)
MIATALLAAVAFAATNIDGAFVLLAFFSRPNVKHAHVVAGTYIGMAVLVIAAMMLAAVSAVLIPNDLGLLGALPVLIGLRQFWTAWIGRGAGIVDISPGAGAFEVVELVAIRTVANGGDNIAVYIPLFAGRSLSAQVLMCVVFAILVGVWCLGARWLVEHSTFVAQIRRWGRWVTPIVLISLGVLIFFFSAALRR